MHTIKLLLTYYLKISVQAANLSDCRIESNRIETYLRELLCTTTDTQGDSDVISMPAGFCRHVVGKTLINVFHPDSAEIRFVGKIVIIRTFS